MLRCDRGGRREIDQLVSVFEHSQLQHASDYFERLQSKEFGQFFHLDVIGHEDPLARLAKLQQISRRQPGRSWRWLRRSARSSRLRIGDSFGRRCEFTPAHDELGDRQQLDLENQSGVRGNCARVASLPIRKLWRNGQPHLVAQAMQSEPLSTGAPVAPSAFGVPWARRHGSHWKDNSGCRPRKTCQQQPPFGQFWLAVVER